jgi:hypothetical protein
VPQCAGGLAQSFGHEPAGAEGHQSYCTADYAVGEGLFGDGHRVDTLAGHLSFGALFGRRSGRAGQKAGGAHAGQGSGGHGGTGGARGQSGFHGSAHSAADGADGPAQQGGLGDLESIHALAALVLAPGLDTAGDGCPQGGADQNGDEDEFAVGVDVVDGVALAVDVKVVAAAGGTGKNCRWPKAKRFLLRWCYRNTNRFVQQVPTGGAKYPVFSMAHQTGANRVCVHVSQLFFYFGFAVNVKNVILRLPHGTIQIDLEAILN